MKIFLIIWIVFLLFIIIFLISSIKKAIIKIKTKKTSLPKKQKYTSQKESSIYLEDENEIIKKLNGKITDDDVPELIKHGFNKRLQEVNKKLNSIHDIYPPDRGKYKLNRLEQMFLDEFLTQLLINKIPLFINTKRMGDGTINVEYKGCQIGRVNLQYEKGYMQILKGLYGIKEIDGNVETFIKQIPAWIRYIKYVRKDIK